MTVYTYPSPNISSPQAVDYALKNDGVIDAKITLSGSLMINSDTATQQQCDDAVLNAAPGSLVSNKESKLESLQLQSTTLANEGVTVTVNSVTGRFPIDQTRFDFSYYESLVFAADRDISKLPISLETIDGGVMSFITLSDIELLADAALERLRYIYLEQTNVDTSKGELGYIIAVTVAADQAALDLIIDTRS